MKNIYLIVGASGSGKTSIANALEKRYGYKQIQSYTTRPPRYEGETGHTFVSKKDFTDDVIRNCVAFTNYNGNYYWATRQQVDECDLYVIDPAGINYFKERYKGDKGIVVITIGVTDEVTAKRMKARGDTEETIKARMLYDLKAFRDYYSDYYFDNNKWGIEAFNDLVERINSLIINIENGRKPVRCNDCRYFGSIQDSDGYYCTKRHWQMSSESANAYSPCEDFEGDNHRGTRSNIIWRTEGSDENI